MERKEEEGVEEGEVRTGLKSERNVKEKVERDG